MPDEPRKSAPQKVSEILRRLHEFVLGPEEDLRSASLDQVLTDLKAEGVDPEPLIRKVRDELAAARAKEEITLAHRRREHLLALLPGLKREIQGQAKSKEEVMSLLRAMLGSRAELAAAYFRKFEEATEDDLQTMLLDLSLLDRVGEHDDAK